MTTADVVLQALRSWGGRDGTVCAPIAEVCALTELSEGQVRRALSELVEDGRLEFTGRRRRKTAVYRFASKPPTPRSVEGHDGDPLKGSTIVTSPTATDDGDRPRRTVATDDDEELTPEEHERRRKVGLAASYAILDRFGDDVIGEPDQPGGECGECGRTARRRYSLGVFVLCRDCRLRRAKAKAQIDSFGSPTAAEPEPEEEPAEHGVDDELAGLAVDAQLRSTNGSSPLWDEPDF